VKSFFKIDSLFMSDVASPVIETVSALERRVKLSVSATEVAKEVQSRLNKLGKNVKMPGFRPGKVPMKMVAQSYGPQVNAEVISDSVSKSLNDAISASALRVAGQPTIDRGEVTPENATGDTMEFVANFEVYPTVVPGDAATLTVERAGCEVSEAEVDKTVEILRKQRISYEVVDRASANEDRLTIDFLGTIDGVAFQGGTAENFEVVAGQGRMLPDFEAAMVGLKVDESKDFPVVFPADYGSADLAGKTASFKMTCRKIEAPKLPELNSDFAKLLGIPDGDLSKLRADVRRNLEREIAARVRARTKNNVMDALPQLATFELPKALVSAESEALGERAKADLQSRGVDVSKIPVPLDAFKEQAEKRVRLGLLVSELVKANNLQAKPDQIRKQIEEFSLSYENPAEVVRYYFSDKERLAEVEALVIEQNVVDFVLGKAKVSDKALSFDDLMAN
jgi:trigger factor